MRNDIEMTTRKTTAMQNMEAGALSGIIGGLFLAAILMVYTYTGGMGFWLPVKSIAGLFYGVDALYGGADIIAIGLITHVVVSAVLGVAFSLFVRSETTSSAAFFEGLLFGVVVWALMTFLVLPATNPVMSERVAMMPSVWFAAHLVFGAFGVLTPAFERRMELTFKPVRF